MNTNKSFSFLALLICVAIPLAIGFLSAMLTRNAQVTFVRLAKPPFFPPTWLSTIVWIVLYVLIGIASYLLYASNNPFNKTALMLYALVLIMNFFWGIIFFRGGSYMVAAVWLFVMWLITLIMTIYSKSISTGAFILFMPYLLWCTYTLYLNIGVAVMNK